METSGVDVDKFIQIVSKIPAVWDRNSAEFRNQNQKNAAWNQIAQLMCIPSSTCREGFKSLREKYVREREKQSVSGDGHIPWRHLHALTFLDPHIIIRKKPVAVDAGPSKPSPQPLPNLSIDSYTDFDRTLITLVRNSAPIWDRKSSGYQTKHHLWRHIAQTLNKDVQACMARWKGLREKYIRQRNRYIKHNEGGEEAGGYRWQFLDDMSFLDDVIEYRKRPSLYQENDGFYQQFSNSYECDDSLSSDFAPVVKIEDLGEDFTQQDSYDSGTSSRGRRRASSDNGSEDLVVESKRAAKTPEQMFGELIAAMLAKKSERDKNIAMIEIMQVLTK